MVMQPQVMNSSDVFVSSASTTDHSDELIQIQVGTEKIGSLDNSLKVCTREAQDSDCNTTVCYSSCSSISTFTSTNDNLFDSDNSAYSAMSEVDCSPKCATKTTCHSTTESSTVTSSIAECDAATTTTKRVQFCPDDDKTKIIESYHDMSIAEVSKYWWNIHEISCMKPTSYHDLEKLHQNCGKKKDCIRGLEYRYWTFKVKEEGGFRKENKDFVTYISEFVPPPRPAAATKSFVTSCDDIDESKKELALYQRYYQHYLSKSQQRARFLALMDEAFVMEHVYDLPCGQPHLESIAQNDRWNYVRCCSCHSDECEKKLSTNAAPPTTNQTSSLGKVVKQIRRRLMKGKGRTFINRER